MKAFEKIFDRIDVTKYNYKKLIKYFSWIYYKIKNILVIGYPTREGDMEIQNISGPDIISSGFTVNSRVTSENVKNDKEDYREEVKSAETEKGNFIDTKA